MIFEQMMVMAESIQESQQQRDEKDESINYNNQQIMHQQQQQQHKDFTVEHKTPNRTLHSDKYEPYSGQHHDTGGKTGIYESEKL